VAHTKDIWKAKVPLKIKIFSWQLVFDKLPSYLQLAVRHGPSCGVCALCGAPEDAAHIFFVLLAGEILLEHAASVAWVQLVPANYAQFHAIASSLSGRPRRLFWVFFLAQPWTLWSIRNKLSIERKCIKHPTDVLYKSIIFLQQWSLKASAKDKEELSWMASEDLVLNSKPSRAIA
jgi:hypothetical protein